jgi:hypothetical protein
MLCCERNNTGKLNGPILAEYCQEMVNEAMAVERIHDLLGSLLNFRFLRPQRCGVLGHYQPMKVGLRFMVGWQFEVLNPDCHFGAMRVGRGIVSAARSLDLGLSIPCVPINVPVQQEKAIFAWLALHKEPSQHGETIGCSTESVDLHVTAHSQFRRDLAHQHFCDIILYEYLQGANAVACEPSQ